MSQSVPNPVDPTTATEGQPATIESQRVAPDQQPMAPVPSGSVKARGISNRALNVLLGGALVLAVAGVAFAAGRMTAPGPSLTGATFPGGNLPGGGVFNGNGNGNSNGKGGEGPRGVFGAGGPTIEGTVESVSDTTLTLKTADGQTIQIALGDATTYHSQTDASASDVVTGSKVLVRLDFTRLGGGKGPDATAGTAGGPTTNGGLTANDVTVVP